MAGLEGQGEEPARGPDAGDGPDERGVTAACGGPVQGRSRGWGPAVLPGRHQRSLLLCKLIRKKKTAVEIFHRGIWGHESFSSHHHFYLCVCVCQADSGFFCEGYSDDDDVLIKEEFRGNIVKQGCLLKQVKDYYGILIFPGSSDLPDRAEETIT